MECKIWDDAATILAWLDSLRVINPLNKTKILWAEKVHHSLILRSFRPLLWLLIFLKLIYILV
jgi:hypothetical protein